MMNLKSALKESDKNGRSYVTTEEGAALLDSWLDLAEAMLGCGAEIRRVEAVLKHLGKSRGIDRINAFTINSYISVTCSFPGSGIQTQSRRIESTPSTDLQLLEQLNTLSRTACSEKMGAAKLKAAIRALTSGSVNSFVYIGGFLSAFSFALFFGSTFPEAVISGLTGILISLLSKKIGAYLPGMIFSNFFFAFLSGCLIYSLTRCFPSLSAGRILIGDIMLLIPGLAITNSVRDIMVGDTISGTMRFVESLLWAGALAVGFATALLLTGGAG